MGILHTKVSGSTLSSCLIVGLQEGPVSSARYKVQLQSASGPPGQRPTVPRVSEKVKSEASCATMEIEDSTKRAFLSQCYLKIHIKYLFEKQDDRGDTRRKVFHPLVDCSNAHNQRESLKLKLGAKTII